MERINHWETRPCKVFSWFCGRDNNCHIFEAPGCDPSSGLNTDSIHLCKGRDGKKQTGKKDSFWGTNSLKLSRSSAGSEFACSPDECAGFLWVLQFPPISPEKKSGCGLNGNSNVPMECRWVLEFREWGGKLMGMWENKAILGQDRYRRGLCLLAFSVLYLSKSPPSIIIIPPIHWVELWYNSWWIQTWDQSWHWWLKSQQWSIRAGTDLFCTFSHL